MEEVHGEVGEGVGELGSRGVGELGGGRVSGAGWVGLGGGEVGINKKREIPLLVTLMLKREDVLFVNLPLLVNWSEKAKRRNTQGTGRMRYLKHVHRRHKNGFREGTKPKSVKRAEKK